MPWGWASKKDPEPFIRYEAEEEVYKPRTIISIRPESNERFEVFGTFPGMNQPGSDSDDDEDGVIEEPVSSYNSEGPNYSVGDDVDASSKSDDKKDNSVVFFGDDVRQMAVSGPVIKRRSEKNDLNRLTLSQRWTSSVKDIHKPILWFDQTISSTAARNPRVTVIFMTLLAVVLLLTGLSTNFNLELDENILWSPRGSESYSNAWWAASQGYEGTGRHINLIFHANGDNVLGQKQVQRVFDALDVIRGLEGYERMCSLSWYRDNNGRPMCKIQGPVQFWGSSSSDFQAAVSSDEELAEQMSPLIFPNGHPVIEQDIFGQAERSNSSFVSWGAGEEFTEAFVGFDVSGSAGVLTAVKSFYVNILFSYSELSDAVEERAIEAILDLDDQWHAEGGDEPLLLVEVRAGRSFSDEFLRGIYSDLPLVPFVVFLMVLFTCSIFFKRHLIFSRMLLGVSAVVAVALSISAGYGVLFIAGVPFTPMSQVLPFILFGIGLDDAFILSGAYFRTDHWQDPVERIRETIDDVGISITVTTLTSTLAFALGCVSAIPSVNWLFIYAFPSVLLVYFYQLTFFVACIALDERRIAYRRMDMLTCIKIRGHGGDARSQTEALRNTNREPDETDDDDRSRTDGSASYQEGLIAAPLSPKDVGGTDGTPAESRMHKFMADYARFLIRTEVMSGDNPPSEDFHSQTEESSAVSYKDKHKSVPAPEMRLAGAKPPESSVDRFMASYAKFLIRPRVKKWVILGFTALTTILVISASNMHQAFSYRFALPNDSYLTDFLDASSEYGEQSNLRPGVYFRNVDHSNETVQQYMKDFVEDLREMDAITGGPDFCWLYEFETFVENVDFVQGLDFKTQLGFFLGVPYYARLFREDIRLDFEGNIASSRCKINMFNVDLHDVNEQIDVLKEVQGVAARQPINEGLKTESFFTSDPAYITWEFYAASVAELTLTAILGIFSVTFIGFLLIPHWTAAPIVFPMMCVLYIDLLGVMNLAGIRINAVSYMTLAMSIGLMVDFIMHILLRFYESQGNREERTIEMLETMGSSVLVGGISTFLGTLPLLFSSSDIFHTISITFLGLVILGVGHGVILLPVLLSIFGTEERISTQKKEVNEEWPLFGRDDGRDDDLRSNGSNHAISCGTEPDNDEHPVKPDALASIQFKEQSSRKHKPDPPPNADDKEEEASYSRTLSGDRTGRTFSRDQTGVSYGHDASLPSSGYRGDSYYSVQASSTGSGSAGYSSSSSSSSSDQSFSSSSESGRRSLGSRDRKSASFAEGSFASEEEELRKVVSLQVTQTDSDGPLSSQDQSTTDEELESISLSTLEAAFSQESHGRRTGRTDRVKAKSSGSTGKPTTPDSTKRNADKKVSKDAQHGGGTGCAADARNASTALMIAGHSCIATAAWSLVKAAPDDCASSAGDHSARISGYCQGAALEDPCRLDTEDDSFPVVHPPRPKDAPGDGVTSPSSRKAQDPPASAGAWMPVGGTWAYYPP